MSNAEAPGATMRPTPLEKLRKVGPVLKGPMDQLGPIQFSSWVNEILPDMLWAVLLISQLPREKALSAFRVVLRLLREVQPELNRGMLGHSRLAAVENALFDKLFGLICEDSETKTALTPLLSIETLPDAEHWRRMLGKQETKDEASILADAIAQCFNHQSQQATDCRWLRVMTFLAQDRMFFADTMADRVKEIIEYPSRGDMRSVRPHIRANEMATRSIDADLFQPYNEEFWKECWEKTDCILEIVDKSADLISRPKLLDALAKLDNEIAGHFVQTIKTTNIDARHDGAFGLVFYLTHQLLFNIKAATGQTSVGRMALRASVEAYITLIYLTKHDNETLWLQYRNYGNGQNKLTYLKSLKKKNYPEFISKETIELYINEDIWYEFLDIKLGAWDNKDLRKMATECDLKDFYDKHYDALSGYTHGNWMAVRHTVFGQCCNPLHRFHRVPVPPRLFAEDSLPDMIKILNLSLDRLNTLYPTFKPRLHKTDYEAALAKSAEAPASDQ